jgi:hypothetical protein
VSSGRVLRPEQFGAVGDGHTDDTDAFAALADFVNRDGGAEIVLRRTTYVVGRQSRTGREGYAYAPARILEFKGCTGRLVIRGNGARLRCADGLRFGTFNPETGQATTHTQPHYGSGELATPYMSMIRIEECSGPVEITDLELDGNLRRHQIGGPWGDTGWQLSAIGIFLVNNRGPERLARIRAHHHALDGIQIDGHDERVASSVIESVVCEHNARQGCSIVGGRNYSFVDCRFDHTGKAGLYSAPGAGVDIEAETKPVRNLRFSRCQFSNNTGVGVVADQGDSEGAVFEHCRFVGTTNWALWPNKPGMRFTSSQFVGSIVNAFGSEDKAQAVQFHNCEFRDDPALSPTGEVYDHKNEHPIADLPYSRNVLFNRCRFRLTHRAVLPWSTNGVIYSDCLMSQSSAKQGYPRGTFVGSNRIDGHVDLYSSNILGELIVNGRLIARTA